MATTEISVQNYRAAFKRANGYVPVIAVDASGGIHIGTRANGMKPSAEAYSLKHLDMLTRTLSRMVPRS